jgi:hypothetical protein
MFNFTDIVSNILLEEPQQGQTTPPAANPATAQLTLNNNDAENIKKLNGFNELVNAYTTQYGQTPAIEEVLKAVNMLTGGKYIAAKYTTFGYIPFIDAFAQSYDKMDDVIDDVNKNKLTQTQIISTLANNPAIYNPIFSKVAADLKKTTSLQEYSPAHPQVNRVWLNLVNETNKLSQTAIQSLGSDTIHSAITKIIAKRIPILDRVMGLKGIVKPFNKSVITPILHQFKKYTGYKQGDAKKNPVGWLKDRLWPKKVPGDFSKMVEDISANNLLNVAVLAYEYYIYLLSTQGKPLNTQTSQTQLEPVNASLNRFSLYVNNILNEYDPTDASRILGGHNPAPSPQQNQTQTGRQLSTDPRNVRRREQRAARRDAQQNNQQQNQQQNQQTTGLPAEQIEKISNQVGNAPDPDYTSFIDNGESRYLPEVKYNLSMIAKDPSKEARALYKALTDMAYFVRPRLSAAQRVGAVAGALGSLRVGMGPVN